MPRPWLWLIAIAALAGCGSEPAAAEGSLVGRFSIRVGEQVGLKLQTIGPGEYASPPALSSSAIRFLDVAQAVPAVPAGQTQLFRFTGMHAGRTIVVFRHTGEGRAVVDTVDVF